MLRLHGVHHTAFPTAKPKETIEFFRDTLGLPVLHAITAKGWGWKGGYPDFFHFFFDAGNGSTIAFFYHVGSPPPPRPTNPFGYQAQARHTAWTVQTDEEMRAWYERLKSRGVKVTPQIRHELIESIYFLDPNDYPLEITRELRELGPADRSDATLSLEAIAETFGPNPSGDAISPHKIDDMWRLKAAKVRERCGFDADNRYLPAVYALEVPEYRPLIDAARATQELNVVRISDQYVCIAPRDGDKTEMTLRRESIPLHDALWYSALVGGLCGRIVSYSDTEIRIAR